MFAVAPSFDTRFDTRLLGRWLGQQNMQVRESGAPERAQ
jgi:hypothetical protein